MNATPDTLATVRPEFTAQMRRVMDHDNAQRAFVVALVEGSIQEIARVYILRSKSGRVQVVVLNYGYGLSLQSLHYGDAGGWGYDKLTAALAGARIGDVVLSDHGRDGAGLHDAAYANGWRCFGF